MFLRQERVFSCEINFTTELSDNLFSKLILIKEKIQVLKNDTG